MCVAVWEKPTISRGRAAAERERERESVCVVLAHVSSVWVGVYEQACVLKREQEKKLMCMLKPVSEREKELMFVCASLCMKKRETMCVCTCLRVKERKSTLVYAGL